jgi:(p)ppGpp synthase/HD superfamily hydrolase
MSDANHQLGRPKNIDPRPLGHRFRQALEYAAILHKDQARKGTDIPYVSHLIAVAAIVLEHGGDEDQAIAALLHDAIEDQGGDATRRQIQETFGARVVQMVNDCTDTEVEPKPPWKERKLAYIEHIASADKSSLLISMADKLHNSTAIVRDYRRHGAEVFKRFKVGPKEVGWYYRSLVEAFEAKGFDGNEKALLEELKLAVAQLERCVGAEGDQ